MLTLSMPRIMIFIPSWIHYPFPLPIQFDNSCDQTFIPSPLIHPIAHSIILTSHRSSCPQQYCLSSSFVVPTSIPSFIALPSIPTPLHNNLSSTIYSHSFSFPDSILLHHTIHPIAHSIILTPHQSSCPQHCLSFHRQPFNHQSSLDTIIPFRFPHPIILLSTNPPHCHSTPLSLLFPFTSHSASNSNYSSMNCPFLSHFHSTMPLPPSCSVISAREMHRTYAKGQ